VSPAGDKCSPTAQPVTPGPADDQHPSPPADNSKPAYYWTWKLLADGYDLAQCRAIRGLDRDTVFQHLSQAAEAGFQVRLEWVLSSEQQSVLDKIASRSSPGKLRALADDLPPGIEPSHVQLYWQIREMRRAGSGVEHF
jgi:uncharacterized protein YpbB